MGGVSLASTSSVCRWAITRRHERSSLSLYRHPNGTLIGPIPTKRTCSIVVLVAGALMIAGCEGGSAGKTDSAGGRGEALAATARRTRQEPPYVVRPLDAFGGLTGYVEIEGPPPPDSAIQPMLDQTVCGAALTRRGIERSGSRAIGVVVSIDGLRSGKPLPIERRFEIANERCLISPEVQPVIVGGTLNVQNFDAVEHRTRLTRQGTGEVLATIRETDEGQVVPNDRVLARPGVIEISCDVHSWTHAWIAVFDHPYYAATGRDGRFAIDSIPPGRYAVRAWHPRLGTVVDSVTIESGKTTQVTLRAGSREP